jgi:hypothetical protein
LGGGLEFVRDDGMKDDERALKEWNKRGEKG